MSRPRDTAAFLGKRNDNTLVVYDKKPSFRNLVYFHSFKSQYMY